MDFLDLLKEILIIMPREVIGLLTPLLSHCHAAFQESTTAALPMGPYFPRKGAKTPSFGLKPQRPGRPMVQMAVPNTQIEPKVMYIFFFKSMEYFNFNFFSRVKTKIMTMSC